MYGMVWSRMLCKRMTVLESCWFAVQLPLVGAGRCGRRFEAALPSDYSLTNLK